MDGNFWGNEGLLPMATDDFFRARLDAMIDLKHPLAVLAKVRVHGVASTR